MEISHGFNALYASLVEVQGGFGSNEAVLRWVVALIFAVFMLHNGKVPPIKRKSPAYEMAWVLQDLGVSLARLGGGGLARLGGKSCKTQAIS